MCFVAFPCLSVFMVILALSKSESWHGLVPPNPIWKLVILAAFDDILWFSINSRVLDSCLGGHVLWYFRPFLNWRVGMLCHVQIWIWTFSEADIWWIGRFVVLDILSGSLYICNGYSLRDSSGGAVSFF